MLDFNPTITTKITKFPKDAYFHSCDYLGINSESKCKKPIRYHIMFVVKSKPNHFEQTKDSWVCEEHRKLAYVDVNIDDGQQARIGVVWEADEHGVAVKTPPEVVKRNKLQKLKNGKLKIPTRAEIYRKVYMNNPCS